ncbi:hypothetical protein OR37_00522 [Caulobacter vibrioides OR37]|uniref:Uncharacterized protein n=2 Tax=Caulobacteraceae TaxID=76892 RepID=R0EQ94_CAUVI|nr:hypothetical protein OR37_00522 [Caulobacter vibrioides OR37]
MTLAPLFDSPCDLAQRIPSMVSYFLDLEAKIGRRFREDSVTDIVIASLLKIAGSNATVLVPPEVKTGGDFDILIVEPATGEAIQYRIQAKRLSPHPTTWGWGSYRELDHPHGQGKQASTLIRSSAKEAIKTIPLYAFYNPETGCAASGGEISGIELADGREINQIVKTLVKAKAASKRPRLKRLDHLRDLFFPLSTILCPPLGAERPASTGIIPPRTSRLAIETRGRPHWMWVKKIPRLPRDRQENLALPSPTQETSRRSRGARQVSAARRFPAVVERALARREEEAIQVALVKRPKIVLVSKGG